MSANTVNTSPLVQSGLNARKAAGDHEAASELSGSFEQLLNQEVQTRQQALVDAESLEPGSTERARDRKVLHLRLIADENELETAEQVANLPVMITASAEQNPMTDATMLPATEEDVDLQKTGLAGQALSGMMQLLQLTQAFNVARSESAATGDNLTDGANANEAALPPLMLESSRQMRFALNDQNLQADGNTLATMPDRDASTALAMTADGSAMQRFSDAGSQQNGFSQQLESKLVAQINDMQAANPMPQAGMLNETGKQLSALMPATSQEVATRFGTTGWQQDVGQKVVWMVGSEQQAATLTLNPPDLGPLQVVISVHNDLVDTTFVSQNPEVRQALQDGMDNLRQMMGQSGLQLGQANVHAEQQAPQQAFENNARQSPGVTADAVSAGDTPAVPSVRIRSGNGVVDTYA